MTAGRKNLVVAVLREHWWKILIGAVLAGFLTEIFNTYVGNWWVYHNPWSIFILPPFPFGFPLLIGWIIITSIALLLTIKFEQIRPRTSVQLYWVIAWIVVGFAIEILNSKYWQTWHYVPGTLWTTAILPILNFSIFVPVVGWGATGIITWWIHKYFIAGFGKGPYKCPVCWMKVGLKAAKIKYRGEIYRFCSTNCKETFRENPEQFAK